MKSNRRKQTKPNRVSYSSDLESGETDPKQFESPQDYDLEEEGGGRLSNDEDDTSQLKEEAADNLSSGQSCPELLPSQSPTPSTTPTPPPLTQPQLQPLPPPPLPPPPQLPLPQLHSPPQQSQPLSLAQPLSQPLSQPPQQPLEPQVERDVEKLPPQENSISSSLNLIKSELRLSFPTEYHRLANELQQTFKPLSNGHNGLEAAPTPTVVPPPAPLITSTGLDTTESEPKDPNGEMSMKIDGTRIFHPDAYCEICDREFCNKYFLKTHKANKHGIYENAPSPFSMNTFPTMIPPPPPPPPQQQPPPEQVVTPSSFRLDTQPQAPKLIPEASVSQDLEDYCELCQKHFCNKYYLKKHKQDVHGIAPENSNSFRRVRPIDIPTSVAVTSSPIIVPQSLASMPNMAGVMVLNPFVPPVAIIPAQPLLHQQQLQPHSSSVLSQPIAAPLPSHMEAGPPQQTPSPQQKQQQMQSQQQMQNHQQQMQNHQQQLQTQQQLQNHQLQQQIQNHQQQLQNHVQQLQNQQLQNQQLQNQQLQNQQLQNQQLQNQQQQQLQNQQQQQQPSQSSQSQPPPPPPPSSSAPSAPPIASDALRSMGVLNAEAYCEICRKEFCNKYFLKIHKANMHNMYTDDTSIRQMQQQAQQLQAQQLQQQAQQLQQQQAQQLQQQVQQLQQPLPPTQAPQPQAPSQPQSQISSRSVADSEHPEVKKEPGQIKDSPLLSKDQGKEDGLSVRVSQDQGMPLVMKSKEIGLKEVEQLKDQILSKEAANLVKEHAGLKDPNILKNLALLKGSGMNDISQNLLTSAGINLSQSGMTSPVVGMSQNILSNSNSECYVTYCNICNREFSSKYSYRIHRMNVHGVFHDPHVKSHQLDGQLQSDMAAHVKAMSGYGGVDIRNGNGGSDGNGMPTLFGNMIAAKLADRVTCDICSKELCNKYFLKNHKLKVHGIDIMSAEKENKQSEGISSSPKLNLYKEQQKEYVRDIIRDQAKELALLEMQKIDMNGKEFLSPMINVEKPDHHELVKMGIDPEAYCEICKKELCSKYFLRTHKLNIHGIKSDKVDAKPEKQQIPQPNKKLMNSLAMSMSMNMNMNMNMSMDGFTPNDSFEKHTWRWKEPVNSSRVICEICNKELCNKYFLRTHKLNKHGILPTDEQKLTPSQSVRSSPVDSGSIGNVSPGSQTEKLSDSFSLLPNSLSDSNLTNAEPKLSSQNPDEVKIKTEQLDDSSPVNNRYYNHFTEVCKLCDRRFKNEKWLHAHVLKDHGVSLPSDKKYIPLEAQMCQFCFKVFPNSISLQMHVLNDHKAEVSVKPDFSPPNHFGGMLNSSFSWGNSLRRKYSRGGKPKLYSCVHCDYKTRWLSNIYSHEERKHSIHKGNLGRFTCKTCLKSFLYEHSLIRHITEYHGTDMKESKLRPKGNRVKKFKCAKCGEKYLSKKECQMHIRAVHVKKPKLPSDTEAAEDKGFYSCRHCDFTCSFAKQLQKHMAHNHGPKMSSPSVRMEREIEDLEDSSLLPHSVSAFSNEIQLSSPKTLAETDGNDNSNNTTTNIPTTTSNINNTSNNNNSSDTSTDTINNGFSSRISDTNSQSPFIMQAFHLEDSLVETNFIPSVVHMPVRQRVMEPVTVTLTLVPAEP